MAKLTPQLLQSMIDGVKKTSGKSPDMIVCGSDEVADQARKILYQMGLDFHVIADDELSPNKLWVTSFRDLGEMPNGGRN